MESVIEKDLLSQMTNEELVEGKKEQLANIDFKMVTFSLSGKDYAIDIMKVKEIAKAGRFTYVPNTAPFVLGVYNLRGDIIPIIDLRLFFNIEVPERTSNEVENMIIVSLEDRVFGVVVDGIDKVVGIESSTIQPPHPLFGDINIKYIYGVVESSDHLYILLDIERIFGLRSTEGDEKKEETSLADVESFEVEPIPAKKEISPLSRTSDSVEVFNDLIKEPVIDAVRDEVLEESEEDSSESLDYHFVIEGLEKLAGFYVSELNEIWVRRRFSEWIAKRGSSEAQLTTKQDAEEFLKPFYSRYTGLLWGADYIDELSDLLPENNAKHINVWNPGCGKGYESYSLACVLKKRYPNAKIKVYAQDIDLLNVSNAPLLSFSPSEVSSWYDSFMTKGVNGSYSFTKEIKESVLFEYHDCSNTNTIPTVDLIFARDILSFVSNDLRPAVFTDFEEGLKGNGCVIVGDNEIFADQNTWLEETSGGLTIYSKK